MTLVPAIWIFLCLFFSQEKCHDVFRLGLWELLQVPAKPVVLPYWLYIMAQSGVILWDVLVLKYGWLKAIRVCGEPLPWMKDRKHTRREWRTLSLTKVSCQFFCICFALTVTAVQRSSLDAADIALHNLTGFDEANITCKILQHKLFKQNMRDMCV